MIQLPETMTKKENEELENLRRMPGWKHLAEPLKVSAELTQAALINFEFEKDDDGRITTKSIGGYEKKQLHLTMLKEFLLYIENGGIVLEEEDHSVYE